MVLKKQIAASSITEVVIALAVIAICFGIASLVFIRSINTTQKFIDFKTQTEIQSELMEMMQLNKESITNSDFILEEMENDSSKTIEFMGSNNSIIWKQEWLKEIK